MGKYSFIDGKRVLVTGGAGFLGSHLVARLRNETSCDVIAPSHRDYDLVKMEDVRRLFADTRPDVVIHLAAAVGGIGANMQHPGKFFYDNLMMGVQLMEQARLNGVKKFVAIGTVCAYPKFTPVPFKEDDIWNGYPEETNAPYGLAKKMLLAQAQAYEKEYGFKAIYLLPANLYGPRDNFKDDSSHVIPAIIKKCLVAKRTGQSVITLWGDGSPTREFLYVDDAAEAILLAADRYDKTDPVNLGTGKEILIKHIAELIVKHVGYTGTISWDTTKPNGQPRRCLDTTRARREFGFESKTSLDEGLRNTIAWYLSSSGS